MNSIEWVPKCRNENGVNSLFTTEKHFGWKKDIGSLSDHPIFYPLLNRYMLLHHTAGILELTF